MLYRQLIKPSYYDVLKIIGGGGDSYLSLHKTSKQTISREIINAEHKYTNIPETHNDRAGYVTA